MTSNHIAPLTIPWPAAFLPKNKNGEAVPSETASPKKDGKQPYRTAQQPTLAAFLPWGSSAGAGRMALAAAKVEKNRSHVWSWKFFERIFFTPLAETKNNWTFSPE